MTTNDTDYKNLAFKALGQLAATEQALSTLLEALRSEEIFYETTKEAIAAAAEVAGSD